MKIKPHPIQKWPERTPLDVIKSISHHLKDKSVCDIGCGAGDLLYEIRRTGLSNNIVGVELQYKFIQMIEKVFVMILLKLTYQKLMCT
jgi:2-polyprenyl-3-methyl-5-hydroxy-6-metoxy-1,4-benzoquinol methylase